MNKRFDFSCLSRDPIIHWGRVLLALFCIWGAFHRLSDPVAVNWEFLLFPVVAGFILMLPYLSQASFSKEGGMLVFGSAADRQALESLGVGGKPKSAAARSGADATSTEDDPQKGQWGGKSEVDGYRLTASVELIPDSPDWFRIQLKCQGPEQSQSLAKFAVFHLHPSFRQGSIRVPFTSGFATLDLVAWGAFTVGVELFDEQGKAQTKLELDLATLESAPALFRSR